MTLPAFDLQYPFLSLPGSLSLVVEKIPADAPYFSVPGDEVEPWRGRLQKAEGLKVCLVSAGQSASHK